jgi:excisionase family DNA binding protein
MTATSVDTLARALADALADAVADAYDRLPPAGPRAYSVAEVAERLDVSDSTVRRLIATGHLATVAHLHPVRVAAATLDEFLAGKP